jgi:hypothetical protein
MKDLIGRTVHHGIVAHLGGVGCRARPGLF